MINAAGVWTDEVQALHRWRRHPRRGANKGVHLVVPRERIRSEAGFITKTEKSVLFVIPWGAFWIIGTTDTPWDLDLAHPSASKTDIDYILGSRQRAAERTRSTTATSSASTPDCGRCSSRS